MSHKHPSVHNDKFIKWLRRTFIAVTFLGIGLMIGKAEAYEDFFDGETLYQWDGVFDDAALIYKNNDSGFDMLDLHSTSVKVIVGDECATLIIDVPTLGPSIMPCVEGLIIGETKQE